MINHLLLGQHKNGNAILSEKYKLWQTCLKELSKETTWAFQDNSFFNNDIYPNVYKSLKILTTLIVSKSFSEHTFSNHK